jgi:hypothetical protein
MCEVHFPLFWLGVARSEFLSSLSSDFVVPSLIPRGQWGPSSSCSRPKREAARLALFSVFPGRFYFLLRPFAGLPPVSKCCLLLTSKACGLIWFVFFSVWFSSCATRFRLLWRLVTHAAGHRSLAPCPGFPGLLLFVRASTAPGSSLFKWFSARGLRSCPDLSVLASFVFG